MRLNDKIKEGNFLLETEGIVSSVKTDFSQGNVACTVISKMPIQAISKIMVEPYDRVELEEGDTGFAVKRVLGKATVQVYRVRLARALKSFGFAKKINASADLKPIKGIIPSMEEALNTFAKTLIGGAPIVVHFHNDCDGASGGIALYRAVVNKQESFGLPSDRISWQISNSIAYSKEAFLSDLLLFNIYKCTEKPLVLVTDFGTTEESVEAIEQAADKVNLIWIDHHPIPEDFPYKKIMHYINPWLFGGDSNTTAGMLTCVFAELLSGIDVDELKQASLIADHSTYANPNDDKAHKLAIVLDALTIGGEAKHGKLTPRYMDRVIKSEKEFDEILRTASAQLAEALEQGVKRAKHYKGRDGIGVHVLNYEYVSDLYLEYVKLGRYASRLHDKFEEFGGEKSVTIVYTNRFMTIRVSKGIASSVRILKAIEDIKANSGCIESGGGHNEAAGLKIKEDYTSTVIKLLLRELGVP